MIPLLATTIQLHALTPKQVRRLERGEVVVSLRSEPDGSPHGTSIGILNKPVERVWALMTDYDKYSSLYTGVPKSQVNWREGNRAEVYLGLWFPWPMPGRWVTLEFEERPDRYEFEWSRKSGSVRRYEGLARFSDWPGNRTLMRFDAVIDPAFPLLPKWLLGYFTAQSLPGIISGPRDYLSRN
ncbi:MAG: SRPBCC family protein [Candidatus Sericytochromatia bacterium]|uniref:SRPBCC family protein n=1 Tax=Candidatus Tanganyikabacteria bacterium TaxID=2961651 RepID=A0A938BNC2_9BACT|nr:SRPBCC family protein [Candidatus Tanganyikabacteria bacterium]